MKEPQTAAAYRLLESYRQAGTELMSANCKGENEHRQRANAYMGGRAAIGVALDEDSYWFDRITDVDMSATNIEDQHILSEIMVAARNALGRALCWR